MHIFHFNKKGFTLMEILGSIAIISLLFVLIIPQVSNAIDKTKETSLLVEFREYETALNLFLLDGNDFSNGPEEFNEYLNPKQQFINNISKNKNTYGFPFTLKIISPNQVEITTQKDENSDIISFSILQTKKGIDSYVSGFSDPEKNSDYEFSKKTFVFNDLTINNSILNLELDDLYDVNDIQISNGSYDFISSEMNFLKIQLKGGASTSKKVISGVYTTYDEKNVLAQNSPNYSDSDGYKGILSKYLHSGAVSISKEVTEKKIYTTEASIPSSINYNSDNYTGTLTKNNSAIKIVTSGSAPINKTVSQTSTNTTGTFANTLSYNSGGYFGTLTKGDVTKTLSRSYEGGYWDSYYVSSGYWESPYIDCSGFDAEATAFCYDMWGSKAQPTWVDTSYYQDYWVSTGTVYVYNYTATYVGSVSTADTRVYGFEQEFKGTASTPDTSVWKYQGKVIREESDTRIYQPLYSYEITVNYKKNKTNN